ncbi:MAG: glycoside hydrolase family 5 protein [Henriciella sp.]|nr:glycoside hydrolase family 5 protein [Henriciella sp.]
MRVLLMALAICLAGCSPAPAPDAQEARLISPAPISRCMNLGGALESPAREGEWGYTVRRQDLDRLAAAGFDTVRLPIRWSTRAALAPPYKIEAPLIERVEEIISWAREAGLNIIVNVHHYDELSEDPDQHEARLEAIWAQLALRFAGMPPNVIFETINEPYGKMTVERTDQLNARLLEIIREFNRTRWVILGTANWGNLDALEDSGPVYDPRVMLTYHDYNPFAFTHQGAFWADPPQPIGVSWGSRSDLEAMAARLDSALAVQERQRMPVLVGEFGVYEEVPVAERARWTRAMREGMEARGLGWCYWDYATTLKAYDLETEAWIPNLYDALLGEDEE